MYCATEDHFWRFYTDEQGDWGWCIVAPTGYIVNHSACFFPWRRDCLADAREHGYQDQLLTVDG